MLCVAPIKILKIDSVESSPVILFVVITHKQLVHRGGRNPLLVFTHDASFRSIVKKADTKAEGSLAAEPPLAMPSDEEWVTLDLKARKRGDGLTVFRPQSSLV